MKDKIRNIYNFYFKNIEAITYNICSIFFIITNTFTFIPLYTDEIIYFNSKIIENITINYKYDNEKKRNNFNLFMHNLIEKNNELITKIKEQKKQDDNINNYIIDNENEYSTSSNNSSDSENEFKNSSSSDILSDKVSYKNTLDKTNSDDSLQNKSIFKIENDYK